MLYQRGDTWWLEFELHGTRHRESTGSKNRKLAKDIEAARRMQLLKQAAGLTEGSAEPQTLREFRKRFVQWLNSGHDDHEEVRSFYTTCYDRLLQFPELADSQLKAIDSAMVERFKMHMLMRVGRGKQAGKSTINRYLATLRKALRYAARPLGLINRVPKITLFPKSRVCERQREFIFSDEEYERWLEESPELLRDASIMARESSICAGELRGLERDSVELPAEAEGDLWGHVDIRRGLKREPRARILPITPAMREVLVRQMKRSKGKYVFAAIDNPRKPLSDNTLSGQARDMKRRVKFHHDAGLHTLRHTYLTEMGKTTDVFTLQKIAGHASVTTTQRYVHPQQEAITRAVSLRLQNRAGKAVKRGRVPTKSPTAKWAQKIRHAND